MSSSASRLILLNAAWMSRKAGSQQGVLHPYDDTVNRLNMRDEGVRAEMEHTAGVQLRLHCVTTR